MGEYGRRILFPVDTSERCKRGFKWYLENWHQKGDLLILANVLTPSYSGGFNALDVNGTSTGLAGDMADACKTGVEQAKMIVESYARLCRAEGIDHTSVVLVGNKVGKAIVKATADNAVDCVVVGVSEMGRARRLLFGSSSNCVVRNVQVPVIVVPPTSA